MKRKALFLIGFIGVILVIFSIMRFVTSRGPKYGELRIDSQPTVTVFLDGKELGKTPYKDKVMVGEYTVKLVPDSASASPWQGRVKVGQNLLTYVNANITDSDLTTAVDIVWLEKISSKVSELAVTTSPDGATLLVDDVSRGATPLTLSDIPPGEHSISVTNLGFLSRSIKIKTTSGYKVLANLKLALSGSQPVSTASESSELTPTPTAKAGKEESVDKKTTPTVTPKPTSANSSSKDPEKPYALIKDTPTGFLRVRIEPSTSASESGRVNPGEKYTIVDSKNGLYQITIDTKNKGWISGQYAEKVE